MRNETIIGRIRNLVSTASARLNLNCEYGSCESASLYVEIDQCPFNKYASIELLTGRIFIESVTII